MQLLKHLKWRFLQQYLSIVAINYCSKPLHIRCLQGRGLCNLNHRFCKEEGRPSPEAAFHKRTINRCSKKFHKNYTKAPAREPPKIRDLTRLY